MKCLENPSYTITMSKLIYFNIPPNSLPIKGGVGGDLLEVAVSMNLKRVRTLKEGTEKKGQVVYWMSRDQRVEDNWALLYAQELALQMKAPLAVIFCLVPQFLNATLRQFGFMLKGLAQVEKSLTDLKSLFFSEGDGQKKRSPNLPVKIKLPF